MLVLSNSEIPRFATVVVQILPTESFGTRCCWLLFEFIVCFVIGVFAILYLIEIEVFVIVFVRGRRHGPSLNEM